MSTVLAVRHLAFEDLGLLGPMLADRGHTVRYLDAGIDPIGNQSLLGPDLAVVLGGPIGLAGVDRGRGSSRLYARLPEPGVRHRGRDPRPAVPSRDTAE